MIHYDPRSIMIHISLKYLRCRRTWLESPRVKWSSNIRPGEKLNPRFVCSWRSYARHWMRNAWFWQTIQFMIFAVPLCFGLFRAFCNVFCIHELPKSAPFFAVFLQYAGFSTFVRAFFSIAKDSHLDWTVSFKTLAVF